MNRSEGPHSPPVEEPSEGGGGPIDMDFIKSFLNKSDEEEQDETPKSGSLAGGEEAESKEERQQVEGGDIAEDKQEPLVHKKRKKKRKVIIKKTHPPKRLPASKEDAHASEDDQQVNKQEDSKQEQKQVKPVPKPRKSLHRPVSARKQPLHNRPASAPRQREEPQIKTASKEVDSDLESIEQVERQNVTQGILVRSPKLKSAKLRMRPQSASKYESMKRADHHMTNGEYERPEMRVTFNKEAKDTENVALRKEKLHHMVHTPSYSNPKYEYQDYHTRPLKQKYEELQELYAKQYHETRVSNRDNPNVMTFAKATGQPLSAHARSHYTVESHKGRRRRRSSRSSSQSGDSRSPSSDKNDPIVIDVSQGVDSKHVKFVGEGESVDSASLDQDSEDILTVEREIALQSLNSSGTASSRKQRSRTVRKAATSPKSKLSRSKTPDSTHSSLTRSSSASPPRSGGRFWSSDTSGSDSPSRSPVRVVPTDCDLRSSDNTRIKQWLKKKNREIRKKKRLERKKLREEMKEHDEKVKEKEEKHEESDKKVAAWMKVKRQETRLLRRKQKNTNVLQITKSDYKFGGKVKVNEEVTVGNVENREHMVADGKEKEDTDVSCQGAGKAGQLGVKGRALSQKRPASAKVTRTTVVDVNMKGQEGSATCSCGYVETQRLKEEELKQTRLAARMRALEAQRARQAEKAKRELLKPTTAKVAFSEEQKGDTSPSPQPSGNLPQIAKGFKGKKLTKKEGGKKEVELSAEEKLEQQKQNYDNWLKKKREQHRKKQQEERRKNEELAKSIDEETKGVVQKVARKRIDNILQQKKHIDTGIDKIDAAANASMDERIQAKKAAAKGREAKDSSNVSNPEASVEGNGVFLTEEQSEPEGPRYVLPEEAKHSNDGNTNRPKGKRPSSARPASAKAKPKVSRPSSAKPDINRPTSRADKVTANHPNPFKLPQPPPPRKHSPSSPRPKVKVTPAYNNVKYQQKSWEDFSQYVWDKVNKDVEDEYQSNERPEPMGADNPDEVKPLSHVSSQEKTDNTAAQDSQKDTTAREDSPLPDERSHLVESPVGSGNSDEGEKEEERKSTNKITEDLSTDMSQEDTYADDFEGEEGLPIPSIHIKSPSPETEEVEDEDGNIKEENLGWNEEDDPTLWDEVTKQVDEELQQKEAAISERLQEEERASVGTPERDEVDNSSQPISASDEENIDSVKPKKSGKSVRFSEEVETQEFVYSDNEEEEYKGVVDQGFGMSNEVVQLDLPLPVDGTGGGEDVEREEQQSDVMGADDAVSFMMKGIIDSAAQNVSHTKEKFD